MHVFKLTRALLAPTLVVAGLLALPAPVRATLIDDLITATSSPLGGLISPGSATIGAGVEFTAAGGNLDFDFGADTLEISGAGVTLTGSGSFLFAGFDTPILGLSVLSNTGFSGLITTGFAFTPTTITLPADLSVGSVSSLVFAIDITGGTAAPEPAAVLLLGLGLAALGVSRRRRTAARETLAPPLRIRRWPRPSPAAR